MQTMVEKRMLATAIQKRFYKYSRRSRCSTRQTLSLAPGPIVQQGVKCPILHLYASAGMLVLPMRTCLLFVLMTAVISFSFADELNIDSLPIAVANTLKAEAGNGIVRSIETFPWGDATIYKIAVDQSGKPYLELQIADNGRLVRVDQLAINQADEEDDTDASPTPRTPRQ